MDPQYQPGYMSEHMQTKMLKANLAGVLPVNKDVRAYFDLPPPDDVVAPWVSKPELPSSDEVMGFCEEGDVFLMPNNIAGPWESKEVYLKAHYDLLREDSVASLRDAVAYVRQEPDMRDTKTTAVYEKVYITGITCAQRGLAFRIQFSTIRSGKKIVWEYSKRLISGSVVALSPANDAFKTKCVVAVVAARPLETVKRQPPEIDIFFANPDDAVFDPQQEWIMVEAKAGYFEAMRHTMTALQKMSHSNFPLAEHICFLKKNIDAPEYVKQDPLADFHFPTVASNKNQKIREPTMPKMINLLEDFPCQPEGGLDATQWEALRQILTKRLSIVQGPPGTGKTHVSVVALRLLLENWKTDDPPIIIASQTNHALDQLLKHISLFEEKYVRLGARSNDPDIKRRTLFGIRRSQPTVSVQGGLLGPARAKSKYLNEVIAAYLQNFNALNSDEPLPASFFLKHEILTDAQYASLEKGAEGWVFSQGEEQPDPIFAWLGEQVEKFEVAYTTENFGFDEDEIDLEYEQLKEIEAEQGLDDDDWEMLRGQFLELREGFCGQCSSVSKATCLRYLKGQDMWKIPVKARGAVYNLLRGLAKEKMIGEFRKIVSLYTENCKSIQIGKWERDYHILRDAKVIGTTTTGLSKYRGLISSIKPKIVLIEEAAEAIEAPIAAACLDSLQHLILVGDHQQLKGSCTIDELAGEPFNLSVSMFERLVNNGMKYVTLREQRRMAPEIRCLIEPIYGELRDHPSVCQRPEVPGMGNIRSHFFSHRWPESTDSLASKYNEGEAEMVAGFFVHLAMNNVATKNITVLTFYNGQRKKILRLLKSHSYLQGQYLNVVTVDSYQGEENEIVILSLVRSGNQIGFLSIMNRVCVALSRAKNGFYLFGNAEALASANPLWRNVTAIMRGHNPRPRVNDVLPLKCVKHGQVVFKKKPSDWDKTIGGCERSCDETLKCGHKCPFLCHSFSHDQVRCVQVCNRKMRCGHRCGKRCADTHSCTCECPTDLGPNVMEVTSEVEAAGVKKYKAFANGGAKEHDALLLKKAQASSHTRTQKAPITVPMGNDDLLCFDDPIDQGATHAGREGSE